MTRAPEGSSHPASSNAPDAAPGAAADPTTLQAALGYRFRTPALLELALSIYHPPLTPENAAARQRLEFLGDAAWNFSVASVAYRLHPGADPGSLTRLRAAWSSRAGLATLARRLGLALPPAHFPQGPSQRVTAELVEAVFGALIEDGGLEAVLRLASTVVAETDEGRPAADPKSSLQMVSLARNGTLPSYRLVERWGPAHHPTFRVSVTLSDQAGDLTAEAEGSSRQAAEQKAAEAVLERLQHVSEKHNIL